jgi:hypothetical protein
MPFFIVTVFYEYLVKCLSVYNLNKRDSSLRSECNISVEQWIIF